MQTKRFRALTKVEKKKFKLERKRFRSERHQVIRDLKAQPCMDCRETFPPEVMVFDEVPGHGGKLGTVASRPSIRSVYAAASRCELVCANCRKIRLRERRIERQRSARKVGRRLDSISALVEQEREAARFNSATLPVTKTGESNA